ncbi:Nitrate reductase delta subunit [Acididesulfobacillus acetoxydans]|uniref:Nitrate reductase delta subunit n=1 Tax=Acididesulfobacillus acetoxydans TaxID=1561005 RepID=A0A8S0WMQ1_9FIRM|nr:nitrate reductase molybdenum cofactor assembly chaperone [Acididesulfobacillus acetoxydans]CAA7600704.1 Nitrate reductase delta subunit [Acididesulfobacillus acetoxydans]CEJ09485.1 Nitrate reductase delta subunit [Acididesulfobacillus acetoxydans]
MKDEGRICHILSVLFRYPEEWLDDIDDQITSELSGIQNEDAAARLAKFVQDLQVKEREEALERYVETFDFSERTNLYLTSHLMEDKQERGRRLAELKDFYAEAGVLMTEEELPDYLPLVLEFCFLKPEYAPKILKRFEAAIRELTGNLSELNSPYAKLMQVLALVMEKN